jgi:hypothetical protein
MAPPWLQTFLAGGFVANKFTGGMLTGLAGELGKISINAVFDRGTPFNPMWTKEVGGLPGGAGGKGGLPISPAAVGGASLLAGGAAVAAGMAALIGIYAISKANQESKNPVPALGYYTTPSGQLAYGPQPDQLKTYKDRAAGMAGGGRGDASTAAEVKRLGEKQALAARIVAAGGKATASRIAAIMEKNARASQSGDDRIAANIGRLDRTLASKNFSPTINVGAPVVNVNTGFTISVRNTKVATASWSRYNVGKRTPTTFEDQH